MTAEAADGDSDYGSDWTADEELILHDILAHLPSDLASRGPQPEHHHQQREKKEPPFPVPLLDRPPPPSPPVTYSPPLVRTLGRPDGRPNVVALRTRAQRTPELQEESCQPRSFVESDESRRARQPSIDTLPPPPSLEEHDHRSPLARWRSKPRKSLSVTDLVAPAWCELSYFYSLTRHGRVRQTPAMKQGAAVHQTLEDQVHHSVAVHLQSKEEAWALRIWNVIQGLRTLRETGLTRELEVWGVRDGLVVNGVIDQLSVVCPDEELEAQGLSESHVQQQQQQHRPLASFAAAPSSVHAPQNPIRNPPKVYLTDVKTRRTTYLPQGASLRPTLMQLMLYHALLGELASNAVDADIIFARYDLDADAPFGDAFLAQVRSLNNDNDDDHNDNDNDASITNQDSPPPLLLAPTTTLRQLWSRMATEFRTTLPHGPASLGAVLQIEYRSQTDGRILGVKTFRHDRARLARFVADELAWWKGERAARGVPIEEAFKCASCEFADDCEWRLEKAMGR